MGASQLSEKLKIGNLHNFLCKFTFTRNPLWTKSRHSQGTFSESSNLSFPFPSSHRAAHVLDTFSFVVGCKSRVAPGPPDCGCLHCRRLPGCGGAAPEPPRGRFIPARGMGMLPRQSTQRGRWAPVVTQTLCPCFLSSKLISAGMHMQTESSYSMITI